MEGVLLHAVSSHKISGRENLSITWKMCKIIFIWWLHMEVGVGAILVIGERAISEKSVWESGVGCGVADRLGGNMVTIVRVMN